MELSSGELRESAQAFQPQTRDQYLLRIYDKTASLFTTAAESGAVLSGVEEGQVQALKGYGYNLGMAFQIVDDILDFEGTAEEFGKPVGNDLLHGVLTLPALISIERGVDEGAFSEFFKNPKDTTALASAVAKAQDQEVIDESYAVAEAYTRKALECLQTIGSTRARESLEMLVSYVTVRRS